MALTEIAAVVLEDLVIDWNDFAEHLTLNLLDKIIDGIPIYETTPFLHYARAGQNKMIVDSILPSN